MSRIPRRTALRRTTAGAFALGLALTAVTAQAAPAAAHTKSTSPDLGANVTVFDPSQPVSEIQATLDAANAKQVDNEMGTDRYAFLFKPGTYGTAEHPLQIKVGYYTELAGLGANPGDVVINGKVEVYNRCLADGGTGNCLALVNFWRTVGNLTVNINGAGQDGCRQTANFWGVSQAVSLRRTQFTGGTLSLMDYCTAGPQYASGGFIADSKLPATVNGSQQQWLTRNSEVASWSNGVWNQVFSGVVGAPDDSAFPDPPYTTVAKTPVSREKPYLFVDAKGKYQVHVAAAQCNTTGVTWDSPGRNIPLSDFFVAKPGDSAAKINLAAALGKNILFTPGVYNIDRSIDVWRPNTVVLGLGHATLTAVKGATPLQIEDVPGVVVAGLTIDAGTQKSSALLRVGRTHGHGFTQPNNPTTLQDVYFRVGGPHVGKTTTALEVNSDDVLIDHTWVWRADHGVEGFTAATPSGGTPTPAPTAP